MHLQGNTLFDLDLDLGINVTQKVVQFCLHHVTYLGTNVKVAIFNG